MELDQELSLKEMLVKSFQLEKELLEFCYDCLKRIYGSDAHFAIQEFKNGVEAMDWNGCIQGLSLIDSRLENSNAEAEKFRKNREQETK